MSETQPLPDQATAVLDFWFGHAGCDRAHLARLRRRWFRATRRMDADVAERFGELIERAAAGELDAWKRTPRGTLALIIVLDQLTRNVHRGSRAAFANDAKAVQVCRDGLRRGLDAALTPVERAFFYMPLQHAEDRDAQRRSVECFEQLLSDAPGPLRRHLQSFLKSAREHRDIIERFGRFPHRNAALGRAATADEAAYLDDGGRRYGQ